ncbi:MAG: MFS transporter, partial [Gammaproteobacteria bacterium]|nr:MFS transporter [Gammaproteobacteria bacterium]
MTPIIKQSNKHPYGLYILALGESCERFSFFGLLTSLVLYVNQYFGFKDNASYTLYGSFIALSYALPILGGIVADRLLGLRNALILGAIFIIVGDIILAFKDISSLYFGLAFIVCGVGFYKPNTTALVGQLYQQHDPRRERGFSLFYVMLNIGAALGPFVYGFAIHWWGWSSAFIISAIAVTIALTLFLRHHKHIPVAPANSLPLLANLKSNSYICIIYLLAMIATGAVAILFVFPNALKWMLIAATVLAVTVIMLTAMHYDKTVKKRLLGIMILMLFMLFFFVASAQIGSSMVLFLHRDVDRHLFNWEIPTIVYSALDPLFVV